MSPAGFQHRHRRSAPVDVIYGGTSVLEACGAKESKLNVVAGGQDGDDFCTVQFTWR